MSSLGSSHWTILPFEAETCDQIALEQGLDPIVVQIMLNRGVREHQKMLEFLNPSLKNLTEPFCPEAVAIAVRRVETALHHKEKIIVYGDYDADGVTGTVVLYDALHYLGNDVEYYVPRRYSEGYGLNNDAIRNFASEGVKLILTVDCGVSNFEEIELAGTLGIDVIVTDHHTPPSVLPPALAIVNPKCDPHSTAYLAGVGVAYRFVAALYKYLGKADVLSRMKYLELVCIGTVTDVVPVMGDNRIFVKKGIEKMTREKSLGLYYLLERLTSEPITTVTIGFAIGPRINAAGRLDSAKIGIELLLTKDRNRAKALSLELNELNERRKLEGEKIYQDALILINDNPEMLDKKVLVLRSDQWEPGVIGIVTAQLARRFERPVVLISTKGTICRGSIRSFAGINVFATLDKCQDLLINYGGHKEAAGFEIEAEKIDIFREHYIQILDDSLKGESLYAVIPIDYELSVDQITLDLYDSLQVLEPYGEANREPIFLTRALNAIDYGLVGKDHSHLKIIFSSGNDQVEAIGFRMSAYKELMDSCTKFDVAYNLTENNYGGQRKLVLKIVDLKLSS